MMLTTAGLTLSMTSANDTADTGARGAAGWAEDAKLSVTRLKASTVAPTAPASQPTRAEFLFHCSVIATLLGALSI
jgi:hypothetical protein